MDPIATLPSGCFSGSPSRARSIAGLTLTELSYSAGTEIPTHAHELPYFSLVLRGSYSERFGHLVRETQALDIIFHPRGRAAVSGFPSGWRSMLGHRTRTSIHSAFWRLSAPPRGQGRSRHRTSCIPGRSRARGFAAGTSPLRWRSRRRRSN